MAKKTKKVDSGKKKEVASKSVALSSAVVGAGVERKKRRKTKALPVKGLRYKLAVSRIMHSESKANPIRADTYRILEQMFDEIPHNVMTQVSIQARALTRKKQGKQRGLKAIHVTNAVEQLIPDRQMRADYLEFVHERLRQYHTAQAE